MVNNIIELTDENFQKEVIESNPPVLVDFWAPWCAPCHMVAPIVEEVAREYQGKLKVGKLNVDENYRTASKYGITAIPTLLLFRGGVIVEQIVGFVPKQVLVEAVERIMSKEGKSR